MTRKSVLTKDQVVFEVFGEGETISILSKQQQGQSIFEIWSVNADLGEQPVSQSHRASSFEEAFEHLQLYPWPLLSIRIHDKSVQSFVLSKLIEKLHQDLTLSSKIYSNLTNLEQTLGVRLTFRAGTWSFLPVDKSAITRWEKSDISFQNYQRYLNRKSDRFALSFIDLLYISNFKGGNSTINEEEKLIKLKLRHYSKAIESLALNFKNKKLSELSEIELNQLISNIEGICDLTQNRSTRIDGFSVSYLSALLSSYFPHLIPILDRRVLNGIGVISKNDLDSKGQVKDIRRFYPALFRHLYNETKKSGISLREIDRRLFSVASIAEKELFTS